MRDENNRNTLADLTYLEFEAKQKLEDTELIPQDDLRDVNTYTEQSLSSEEADHIAYSQDTAAPADARPEDRSPLGGSGEELGIHQIADDETDREWRAIEGEPATRPGDEIIDEYAGGPDQRVAADAALTGSGTAFLNQDIFTNYSPAEGEYKPLEDVPDADAISANSPVDPAAPSTDEMHGTDLLNGSHGDEGDY